MNTLDTIATVVATLRDHPDVEVGNSKVHFAYHKAKAVMSDIATIFTHDRVMSDAERVPTGDDYNEVLGVLGKNLPASADDSAHTAYHTSFPTVSVTLTLLQMAAAIQHLAYCSVWFAVEPLPDDLYAVYVKPEHKHKLPINV